MAPAELEKFRGFWRDAEKTAPRPGRLLAEAAIPTAQGRPEEPQREAAVPGLGGLTRSRSGARSASRPSTAARDGGLVRDGAIRATSRWSSRRRHVVDDPDALLDRFITGLLAELGRFSDPRSTTCTRDRRGRSTRRAQELVIDMQKIVLEKAYTCPGLWWSRNVVHWTKVKNWVAPPSHFTNSEAPGRLALGGLTCDSPSPL
jgi:hypothetical protein